ncbi:Adaptor complexes medium subunit family, putative [Angomonas deanei]|uniref:Adaptor complexes medium subunit family, putative n=1 Tax=Angomonas deanei TaxID=59799 RepID=A0A7G2C4B5_9TRYP|nr:Adaptor complexes medium subunit family, putative [Angomonas deanei]
MLESIHFLNAAGDVIVELFFGKKFPRSQIQNYWNTHVTGVTAERGGRPPCIVLHQGVVFCCVESNYLYVLGTTTQEDSALLLVETLWHIIKTIQHYLVDLSETTLRNNFSLVCQIIQEMIDFGYPLTSQLFELEELVPRPTMESKLKSIVDFSPAPSSGVITQAHLGLRRTPWRSELVKYAANEILFDVVEYLDVVMDGSGRVSKTSVRGEVQVNCHLSGMPEVVLRLSNRGAVEDFGFHRCVNLQRFETDGAITFIPPDGKFTLFQYKCSPARSPDLPFYVTPQITVGDTAGRFTCMAGIKGGRYGGTEADEVQDVKVRLVLPPDTTAEEITCCTAGSAVFLRDRGVVLWSIGKMGKYSPTVSGTFDLRKESKKEEEGEEVNKTTTQADTQKKKKNKSRRGADAAGKRVGCATVEFTVPNMNVSGFSVDSVQILNSENIKPYKGVKYLTRAGTFVIRAT